MPPHLRRTPAGNTGPDREGKTAMLARRELDPQEALVCTMVLVAASDGAITDREVGTMSGLVQTLPIFHDFSTEQLDAATEAAIGLLEEEDGLNRAGGMICSALSPRLRETAYALACDVASADRAVGQPVLRMLEFLVAELELDHLVAAAIERGARARHRTLE